MISNRGYAARFESRKPARIITPLSGIIYERHDYRLRLSVSSGRVLIEFRHVHLLKIVLNGPEVPFCNAAVSEVCTLGAPFPFALFLARAEEPS